MELYIKDASTFTSPYQRAEYIGEIDLLLAKLKGQELENFCQRLEKKNWAIFESKILGTDTVKLNAISKV